MFILNENNEVEELNDIDEESKSKFYWSFDMEMRDYTLSPILITEDICCKSVRVVVGNMATFILPSHWVMLVFDEETHQIDLVEIREMMGKDFTAYVSGPEIHRPLPGHVRIVDILPEHSNVAPSLDRTRLMCHPISTSAWISVGGSDVYGRYLKELLTGDVSQ